jgi:transcriptional regulator with XRE-family HTH domain
MPIGETIRARRLARKLTQVELSQRSGVPQVTISAIECGRHKPSFAAVTRLAKALGLKLDKLAE